MFRIAHIPAYAGIRGSGPRQIDLILPTRKGSGVGAYEGPFAVERYDNNRLSINPGHVWAGDYAEYGYPGQMLSVANIAPVSLTGGDPNPIDLFVYLPIEVDPAYGVFTDSAPSGYEPDTAYAAYFDESNGGFSFSTDSGGPFTDSFPHNWVILAQVRIEFERIDNPDPTPDTYNPQIDVVYQRQYGDIRIPVFYSWGINSVGGNRWENVEDAEYYVGWQHGHFMGRPILEVPGIDTIRVAMSAPYLENGYNGALIDRQWPWPPSATNEEQGSPGADAGDQLP